MLFAFQLGCKFQWWFVQKRKKNAATYPPWQQESGASSGAFLTLCSPLYKSNFNTSLSWTSFNILLFIHSSYFNSMQNTKILDLMETIILMNLNGWFIQYVAWPAGFNATKIHINPSQCNKMAIFQICMKCCR